MQNAKTVKGQTAFENLKSINICAQSNTSFSTCDWS